MLKDTIKVYWIMFSCDVFFNIYTNLQKIISFKFLITKFNRVKESLDE